MAPEPTTQEAVTQDSAPASAVNQQEAETTATETTATQETTEQSQETTQESPSTATTPINADLYDERGVPWKNVAMEHRRKYEETQQNLPRLIAEEIAKTTQQQQQKKYTISELETFAQEKPEYRAWVEEEKAKVIQTNLEATFNQKIEATTKKQQDEVVRGQVFNEVLQSFPDIAIRNQQGQFVGWNNTNPMTQLIGQYMSSPELSSRPDGLRVASKLAYADMMLQKSPQNQKVIQALKSQVKKVQAGTFVEGNGRKVSETTSPTKKYLDRVAQSGKAADAAGVFAAIHRQMGMTKE